MILLPILYSHRNTRIIKTFTRGIIWQWKMNILPVVYNHQNELAADKTLYDEIISWLTVGM